MNRAERRSSSVVYVVRDRNRCAPTATWIDPILGMVPDIERFRTELESNPLGNGKRLSKVHVPVVNARLSEDIASTVAELTS